MEEVKVEGFDPRRETIENLKAKFREQLQGMWIAVLDDGRVIADKDINELVKLGKRSTVSLFRIPRRGMVMQHQNS